MSEEKKELSRADIRSAKMMEEMKAAYDAQLDGAFSTTGEGVAFVRGLLRLG